MNNEILSQPMSMEPVAFVCAPSDSSPISMTCPVKSLDILATMHNAPLYTATQLAAARQQGAEEERKKFYGQDKPAGCVNGCPSNQVCDYCQIVAPAKRISELEAEVAAARQQGADERQRECDKTVANMERMWADIDASKAKRIAELEKSNAVLLEALKELSLYVAYNGDDWVQRKARAAIAEVKP